MNLTYCFVLLLIFSFNNNIIYGFDIISSIVVFKSVLKILDVAVDLYDEFSDDTMPQTPKEQKLYDAISNVTNVIEDVERNVPQVTIAKMKQLERDFSKIIHFEIKLEEFVKHINNIESRYEVFLKLRPKIKTKIDINSTQSKKADAIKYVLTDFANSVVTFASGSVQNSLTAINDMIVIRESSSLYTKDIFSLFLENFNTNTESRCLINKSPQQLIFDVHTSLRVVQLKAEILFEFSYMILHLYGKGDFKDELNSFRDDMRARYNEQMNVANSVISNADNSYWRCDPPKHVAEQTYTELKHLVQGYIHNEKELNSRKNCFDGCNYYQYISNPTCDNTDPLCTIQPACRGRVFDCKFVAEDMNICYANSTTGRRYDWIRYQKGPAFGHAERGCSYSSHRVEGYRKYLFWRCMYCFCMCDEETMASERYFSLEPVVSDVENNRIVVGLQFVKQNRVLQLQVREAKLLAGGSIDNKTLSWVTAPPINVNSWLDKQKFHKLNYESRGLDLDDLKASPRYLVTGVRFRTLGAHLNLEVQLTGFNFETGELYGNLSYWKGNDNTDVSLVAPRSRFALSSTQLPTDPSSDANIPDSVSDSFLEFVPSDERTDAAQSTVPFIDIQPVVPNPPVPLVGVGIAHKGSYTSAGFIEPKVFTLNVGQMLSDGI